MKIKLLKVTSVMICLIMTLSYMTVFSYAEETTSATAEAAVESNEIASGVLGENFTWVLDKKYILTIRGKGYMDSFLDKNRADIPWYEYQHSIRKVVIDEGIKSVGFNCFRDCFNLISISLPSTLLKIEGRAFEGCYSLKYVKIPSNVEDVDMLAFGKCKSLVSVVVTSKYTKFNDLLPYGNTDGAFEQSKYVTIFCKTNSYAQKYAKANKINYSFDFNKATKLTALTNAAYKKNGGYINLGFNNAKVTSITKSTAAISWASVFPWDSGRSPDKYKVYVFSDKKNKYVLVSTTKKTSIKLTKLTSGGTYKVKIVPIINDRNYDDEYRIIVQFKTNS